MSTNKRRFYYILIAVLVLAIVLVMIKGMNKEDGSVYQQEEAGDLPVQEESSEPGPLFGTEHTISAELIQEGLRDMGFLVTQEYDCTGVLSNSKVKSILGINLPFTESSYLFSYDATVEAGIDFTAVTVEKDDDKKTVTIHLPKAEVGNVSVDPDSFTKYEEKDGLGTKMTITDYNDSLQQFEETVTEKAIEKGLLEKADSNARTVVMNFVKSIMNDAGYRITID